MWIMTEKGWRRIICTNFIPLPEPVVEKSSMKPGYQDLGYESFWHWLRGVFPKKPEQNEEVPLAA